MFEWVGDVCTEQGRMYDGLASAGFRRGCLLRKKESWEEEFMVGAFERMREACESFSRSNKLERGTMIHRNLGRFMSNIRQFF